MPARVTWNLFVCDLNWKKNKKMFFFIEKSGRGTRALLRSKWNLSVFQPGKVFTGLTCSLHLNVWINYLEPSCLSRIHGLSLLLHNFPILHVTICWEHWRYMISLFVTKVVSNVRFPRQSSGAYHAQTQNDTRLLNSNLSGTEQMISLEVITKKYASCVCAFYWIFQWIYKKATHVRSCMLHSQLSGSKQPSVHTVSLPACFFPQYRFE